MRTTLAIIALGVALATPSSAQQSTPVASISGHNIEAVEAGAGHTTISEYEASRYELIYTVDLDGVDGLRRGPDPAILDRRVVQDWTASDWENDLQSMYSYNEQGDVSERLDQAWNGVEWNDESRLEYSYSEGQLAVELLQRRGQQDWINVTRRSYTYLEGELAEWVEQVWTEGGWVNSIRIRITMGLDGNREEGIVKAWDGTAWRNYERYVYTYIDGSNDIESITSERWRGGAWVNSVREVYSYVPDGLSILLRQEWSASEWVNDFRKTYTYEAGYRIGSLAENWNGTVWEQTYRLLHTNDQDGNRLVTIEQAYVADAWSNELRTLYEYAATTPNEQDAVAPSTVSLSVYPNPSVRETTLGFELEQAGLVDWAVFDVMGRRVAHEPARTLSAGPHGLRVDVGGLPAGVYVVQLRAEGAITTSRFTVLR